METDANGGAYPQKKSMSGQVIRIIGLGMMRQSLAIGETAISGYRGKGW